MAGTSAGAKKGWAGRGKRGSVIAGKKAKAGHVFNVASKRKLGSGPHDKFWNIANMQKSVGKSIKAKPKAIPVSARRTTTNLTEMKRVSSKK